MNTRQGFALGIVIGAVGWLLIGAIATVVGVL